MLNSTSHLSGAIPSYPFSTADDSSYTNQLFGLVNRENVTNASAYITTSINLFNEEESNTSVLLSITQFFDFVKNGLANSADLSTIIAATFDYIHEKLFNTTAPQHEYFPAPPTCGDQTSTPNKSKLWAIFLIFLFTFLADFLLRRMGKNTLGVTLPPSPFHRLLPSLDMATPPPPPPGENTFTRFWRRVWNLFTGSLFLALLLATMYMVTVLLRDVFYCMPPSITKCWLQGSYIVLANFCLSATLAGSWWLSLLRNLHGLDFEMRFPMDLELHEGYLTWGLKVKSLKDVCCRIVGLALFSQIAMFLLRSMVSIIRVEVIDVRDAILAIAR